MNLLAEDYLKLGSKLYFVSKDTNIIYCIDENSGETELIDCIPEESPFEDRLCSKIIFWHGELIFIPVNAKKIWRFNIDTRKWHGIDLGNFKLKKNKIFQAVIYQDELFMFGCSCPAIFQLNLITEQLIIIEQPYRYMNMQKMLYEDIYFKGDFAKCGTSIYLASGTDNVVMKFDLHSREFRLYEVGDAKNRYSGIAWDGKNFWLAPRHKTPLVKWNGKEDVTEYELPKNELENEAGFIGIVDNDNYLILPGKKKYSIVIERNNDNLSMDIVAKAYTLFKRRGDVLLSLDTEGELIVDNNGNRQIFQCFIDDETLKNFQFVRIDMEKISFSGLKNESVFFNLNKYADNILCMGHEHLSGEGIMGRNMWNRIKGNV